MQNEYRIPADNLPRLTDEIARLAKIARKINVPVPAMAVLRTEEEVISIPLFDVHIERQYAIVRVTGTAPVIRGWSLAATLSHGDGGTIIRSVPEEVVPARYRDASPDDCDHCGMRRRRNDTFLLRKGHDSPQQLASWLEDVDALCKGMEGWSDSGDDEMGGNWGKYGLEVRHVIALAAGAVVKWGYTSKAQSADGRGTATSDRVSSNIYDLRSLRERRPENVITPDYDLADKAIAHYRAKYAETQPTSDFDHNLSVIINSLALDHRNLGYACYVPAGYARDLERDAQRKAAQVAKAGSKHIGTVGQRLQITATVTYVRPLERQQYSKWDTGMTYLVRLLTDEGNIVVWFASSGDWKTGDRVSGGATVKAHNARDGVNETQITRPRFAKTAPQR